MRHHSTFRLRTLIGRATFIAAFLIVLGVLFGYGVPAFAQGAFGIDAVDSKIGLSGKSIVLIILSVIRFLLGLLGLILVVMIIYAGYTIMTSAGDAEKVERGKIIIKNAVIGTAIILFSFIIVQFIINILMDVTGLNPKNQSPPGIETFAGIGSLGQVIKDHYPLPNQTNVYRNTKIVITFTEAIDPSSIIENTNNTCWGQNNESTTVCDADALPYYGDCAEVQGQTVCDTLKTDENGDVVDGIIVHKLSDAANTPGTPGLQEGDAMHFDALVAYENINKAHIFVFKLQGTDLLGNGEADQWHEVEVTNAITNEQGEGIFSRHSEDAYSWKFQTNTEIDLTPPHVVDVSPNPGLTIEKNKVLKVTFNEAVDPMTVQGMLGPTSSFTNIVVDVFSSAPVSVVSDSSSSESVYAATYLSTFSDFGDKPSDFAYDGEKYLYVAYNDGRHIAKLDVTDPEKVALSGEFEINYSRVTDIELQGPYLYVVQEKTDSVDGSLHILQVSDMTEVGSGYTELSDPYEVAVIGNYAYVANGAEGIAVLDVSTPTNIVEMPMSDVVQTGVVRQITVAGDKIYYGGKGGKEFGVANIRNTPEDPEILGEVALTKTPTDIIVHGTHAYVAVGSFGLRIIDISDPATSMDSIVQFTTPGFDGKIIYSLDVEGDLLAVGEREAFKLFDLSEDPVDPTFLFSYPDSAGSGLVADDFRPVILNGIYLYVGQKNDGVQIFNIFQEGDEEVVAANPGLVTGEANNVEVNGQWKITNGYKSIEFLSSEPCGNNVVNSCGDPIYCLPTACADYDKTCTASYSVLARTATLKDPLGDSFAAANLFDGVVDMADNALDSAQNIDEDNGSMIPGSYDTEIFDFFGEDPTNPWRHKPPFVGVKNDIDSEELYSDNYWWNFTVINDIDSTSPYLRQVNPNIDQQAVLPYSEVDLYFSKEMLLDSLTNVKLIEYPSSDVGLGYTHDMEDIPATETFGTVVKDITRTVLHILHPARPFGPGGDDYWYFTNVPGKEVKANNQFCLYPGRGPYAPNPQKGLTDESLCNVTYDEDWQIVDITDGSCRPKNIEITSSTDTGCVSTYTGLDTVTPDTETCIDAFSDPVISKIDPK